MRTSFRTIRIHCPRAFAWLTLLVCIIVFQPPTHAQTAHTQEKHMQHYALLFHTAGPGTPEEQKQRAIEIAAWVKQVTDMGVALDPRPFGAVAANLSMQGNEIVSRSESTDASLSIIVYFDAPTREQALHIARIHPGLHYGVTVEVREWAPPRVPLLKP